MKIGVLGTGMVGQTLASKLTTLGHDVVLGSRTADNEKALAWAKEAGQRASVNTFEQAARAAEVIFNCTLGSAALEVLHMAKEANLAGKVLVDITNPLAFAKGMAPSLTVCNTDSLGEQLQRAFPNAKVVKTLNTMSANVMVNPRLLPETHVNFLCGNDPGAKATVKMLLKSMGWHDEELIDLGDITGARGMEMWLPLWLRIFGATKSTAFNLKLVVARQT
jgi:predicted dinucleotide-binding enzyme